MLTPREFFPLGAQHLETSHNLLSSFSRVDDIIDVPTLGCGIGVGVLLGVLRDQLTTSGGRVGGLL